MAASTVMAMAPSAAGTSTAILTTTTITVESSSSTDARNTSGTDSAITAFMQSALDNLGSRSRQAAASLRLQREIIVDGWLDRFTDLTEQYMEDQRQIRAHVCRARHSLTERLERLQKSKHRQQASFPQFALLPAEIRLQIWEEALPGARAVMLRAPYPAPEALRGELKLLPGLVRARRRRERNGGTRNRSDAQGDNDNDNGNGNDKEQENDRDLGWTSPTPPPAMLHTCSESREVALRRYSLVFATTDNDGKGGADARIYADLSRDVVCLSSGEVSSPECSALWRRTRDLGRVRHLAVAAPACWGSWSSHYGSGFAHRLPPADLMGLAGFAALEDVIMVRSIRWQYGRLPRAALLDFAAWAEREEAYSGLTRYHIRWRDGVMAIRHGRRKSSDQTTPELSEEETEDEPAHLATD